MDMDLADFLHTGSGFVGQDHESPDDNLHYAKLLSGAHIPSFEGIDSDVAAQLFNIQNMAKSLVQALSVRPREENMKHPKTGQLVSQLLSDSFKGVDTLKVFKQAGWSTNSKAKSLGTVKSPKEPKTPKGPNASIMPNI